jgi:serine/threonine protein kinase
MPLSSGTKLGPYEIQSQLGAGGMGEVYRARDTRLDRTVAIKVLASNLSSSPELKQRMEREARAISSLNHPHICQLYDIGSQNGADYLVMEFLEGETLAERLRKGPIPLQEIYRISIAIAEALALAHRHGIMHRDLKPGNIMLTQSGAKLMDFGLAKPLNPVSTGSTSAAPPSFTAAATLSGPSPLSPLTTAGTIVGTIQYMSPEQIEGKEADARSDIFALGAVLYEMTTGKRPFEGKSQLSLASSILEKDPDSLLVVKPATPPAFDHLVATCLQKNPDDRYQSAQDVKIELQWIASEKPVAPRPAQALPGSSRRQRIAWSAALVIAVGLSALGGFLLHRPVPVQSIRTVINPPEKTTLNLAGDSAGPPILSPDGSFMAFTATAADGKSAIWIRPVNSLEARVISGSENAIFPFWSPDSRSLGFFADGKLKTIEIDGGSAQILADAPFGRGGAWGPGVIVFSPSTQAPLMRSSLSGGTPVVATQIEHPKHTSHRWPFFLPDGKHYVYLAINHDATQAANNTLYYASVDGKENRPLFRSQSNAVYADGYLLFARVDQLMAQAFDVDNGSLNGEPLVVARGVVNDAATWHMDASASEQGLLVFGTGGSGDWQLVWVDRDTKAISMVADKIANLQLARLSPQGDRIALQIDSGSADIWVLDVNRGVRTRLTFGPVGNTNPIWSPDGKWVLYDADRNGHANLCRKLADGSGSEETLLTDEQIVNPSDWSRDGKYIIYERGSVGDSEIWALPLTGDRKPLRVVTHAANAAATLGHLSPDGRWLAYMSTESGALQVYVIAFQGGQGKWQVSTNGGTAPQWSKDGKQLYYLDPTFNLLMVPVKQVNGALQFGATETVIASLSAPQIFYDVSPDGKKILLDRISQQVSQSVTAVTNFAAALKK